MTIPGFVLRHRLLAVFAFTLIWLFVKKDISAEVIASSD
jgi:hypothetical protein